MVTIGRMFAQEIANWILKSIEILSDIMQVRIIIPAQN